MQRMWMRSRSGIHVTNGWVPDYLSKQVVPCTAVVSKPSFCRGKPETPSRGMLRPRSVTQTGRTVFRSKSNWRYSGQRGKRLDSSARRSHHRLKKENRTGTKHLPGRQRAGSCPPGGLYRRISRKCPVLTPITPKRSMITQSWTFLPAWKAGAENSPVAPAQKSPSSASWASDASNSRQPLDSVLI